MIPICLNVNAAALIMKLLFLPAIVFARVSES